MNIKEDYHYIVYVHIFPNGKRYVGITCQKPNQRWRRGRGYIGSNAVYNAIKKYGWDNIEHKILFRKLSKKEAEDIEVRLIREWKTKVPNGYNLCDGGNVVAGHKVSEKTKQHLREINLGKHHTEESKRKNILHHTQKIICLETGKIYNGAREAARMTNGSRDGIAYCLRGIYHQSHGYHWMKYSDYLKGGGATCK